MYIATDMRQKNDITNTQNAENQHVTQVSSINLINTGTMITKKHLKNLVSITNDSILALGEENKRLRNLDEDHPHKSIAALLIDTNIAKMTEYRGALKAYEGLIKNG